jgi:hypothetical protein
MISDVDAPVHWPGKTVTRISEAAMFWEMDPRTRITSCAFRSAANPRFLDNASSPETCLRLPRLGRHGRSRSLPASVIRTHTGSCVARLTLTLRQPVS